MRRLLLSMCFLGCALWAQTKDLTQYVNPLMGTFPVSNYLQVIHTLLLHVHGV